jgi:alanyl-tRNA synthetase
VKLHARAVSGVELKFANLADEGKRQVGSGVVVIVATPRTARRNYCGWRTDDLINALTPSTLLKEPKRLAEKGAAVVPTWRRPWAGRLTRPKMR